MIKITIEEVSTKDANDKETLSTITILPTEIKDTQGKTQYRVQSWLKEGNSLNEYKTKVYHNPINGLFHLLFEVSHSLSQYFNKY